MFVISPRAIRSPGVVKYLNIDFNKPEHICDSLNRRMYERLSDVNLINQRHKQKRTTGVSGHRISLESWQIFLRH